MSGASWALAAGAAPWHPMAVFGLLMLLDGLRLGLPAVMLWRVAKVYRCWNQACLAVEGKSFVSLCWSRSGGGAGGSPSALSYALVASLACLSVAVGHWIGPDAGDEYIVWLLKDIGGLGWAIFSNLVLLVLYTVVALRVVSGVIEDKSSPIGAALHAGLGDVAAKKASESEAEELSRSSGPSVASTKGPRRL